MISLGVQTLEDQTQCCHLIEVYKQTSALNLSKDQFDTYATTTDFKYHIHATET